METKTKYYCVGFQWTEGSQLDRFLKDGIWENGDEEKFQHTVNEVPVGARLAAKTTYTRKDNGKTISVLHIYALGTVTENKNDGQRLIVNWDKDFKPFSLDGRGAYRSIITSVVDSDNIRLIFNRDGIMSQTTGNEEPALSFDPEDLTDEFPANLILYGPPGTGKTYHTINKAVAIADGIKEKRLFKRFSNRNELKDRFDELLIDDWDSPENGQIAFVTFHQSMSYEDFVEGVKATLNDKREVAYDVESGILKKIADLALSNWLNARKGTKGELLFEEAFSRLRDEWDENPSMKFSMKTEGKEFTVTEFTKSSIKFKKASGGTKHTLSISTLRDYYYNRREIRVTGVGIYYPGVLEKLKSFVGTNSEQKEKKNYVLVIDEINRGNIAQIFGELITLIEDDKRIGRKESIVVTLPYSKERFTLPPNLYIVGTMNTADRSVEALDTALRRRFVFEEMSPEPSLLKPERVLWQFWWDNEKYTWDNKEYIEKETPFYKLLGFPEEKNNEKEKEAYWGPMRQENAPAESQIKYLIGLVESFENGVNLSLLLDTINKRIERLLGRDYMIGHAYLINVRSIADLKTAFFNKIIPLLQEYFYRDHGRIGLVIGTAFLHSVSQGGIDLIKVPGYDINELNDGTIYHIKGANDFDSDEVFIAAIKNIYEPK
ncbi:McrB family protein [Chitinophaga sp. HK235]|uniref:McrB family protein n=1 Tax=Chitinophaga sp. HK235 TaxID=2952571 RepID=UPI001BADAED8|nr:AAA family ATPase [Chitinophaga sp. HK235]